MVRLLMSSDISTKITYINIDQETNIVVLLFNAQAMFLK